MIDCMKSHPPTIKCDHFSLAITWKYPARFTSQYTSTRCFQNAASLAVLCVALAWSVTVASAELFVSPQGKDTNPGTSAAPLQSFSAAQQAARRLAASGPVTVTFSDGVYYLPQAVVFTADDSGTAAAPVVYQAASERGAVLSGGVKLDLTWKPYKDGILQAQVPEDLETEELFINGERQILARYPNFNPSAEYFDGFAADALSPERAVRWANPAGGYFHAMHRSRWGGFTWRITGKNDVGEIIKEGGWQNNRDRVINKSICFVENIFEELDAPGEWFLNRATHTLYYYPPAGLNLANATVEAARLRTLVEFSGDEQKPVRFVSLRGFTFRHAARTVMDTKEPLLRTDWAIYRGGAVFINGAEDCQLIDALIDQVGGNAVFVNNYNRRITVRGCEIRKAGANGICFVGDPQAVRNPLFNFEQTLKFEALDRTPGPLTTNYPADSLVEDCLIHLTGRVEKQTAGVEIDIAQSITVRHCSIYDMPRAGINIGGGAFGGHIVEFCDVFDTVKETGDHGSFNSWGRDRYWVPMAPAEINIRVQAAPELPLLDVVKPNTLRNSRWRCDHGWDIDLDDGSSNYVIENNLCLNGGIKNREGYHRTVQNNILANNWFHPHVWLASSGDVFRRNIVFGRYKPAGTIAKPWGKEMDCNLVHQPGLTAVKPAADLQEQSGRDEHSVEGDALFINPAAGDFQVKDGSPALALGFKNFPMDQFGVTKPALKAVARTPSFEASKPKASKRDRTPKTWLTARVRNLVGQGEMSVYGTPGATGVLVLDVPAGSALAAAGLQKDDVIFFLNGKPTDEIGQLLRLSAGLKPGEDVKIGILRTQKALTLNLSADNKVATP